jgi:hypothetical protein
MIVPHAPTGGWVSKINVSRIRDTLFKLLGEAKETPRRVDNDGPLVRGEEQDLS